MLIEGSRRQPAYIFTSSACAHLTASSVGAGAVDAIISRGSWAAHRRWSLTAAHRRLFQVPATWSAWIAPYSAHPSAASGRTPRRHQRSPCGRTGNQASGEKSRRRGDRRAGGKSCGKPARAGLPALIAAESIMTAAVVSNASAMTSAGTGVYRMLSAVGISMAPPEAGDAAHEAGKHDERWPSTRLCPCDFRRVIAQVRPAEARSS
jgi:hypothetical protein